jgi:hypothetical protein
MEDKESEHLDNDHAMVKRVYAAEYQQMFEVAEKQMNALYHSLQENKLWDEFITLSLVTTDI